VTDRFEDLLEGVDDPREQERLRRVHELLLSVEGPPELSPAIQEPPLPEPVPLIPRRRRGALALLAAALAAAAFGAGWLGGARSDDVAPEREIVMSGVGETRGSFATIEVLPQDADENGNWPMRVLVRGLQPSKDRDDYYELWLTKNGKPADSCGRFLVHEGLTTVMLTVPYGFKRYDGWVVTRQGSDRILLTT
jgi:hypothetical protein